MDVQGWVSLLDGFEGLQTLLENNTWSVGHEPAQLPAQSGVSTGGTCTVSRGKRERGKSRSRAKGTHSKANDPKALEAVLAEKLVLYEEQQQMNSMLRARCSLMEKVVEAREEQIQLLKKLRKCEQQGGPDPLEPFGCSLQSLRACKGTKMLTGSKEMMSIVGGLMAKAGKGLEVGGSGSVDGSSAGPGAAAGGAGQVEGDELEACGRRLMEIGKYTWLIHEDHILVSSRNVNTVAGGADDNADDSQAERDVDVDFLEAESHWEGVVQVMGLSPEQGRDAWLLHDLYVPWHDSVLKERRELSAQLSQLVNNEKMGTFMAYPRLLDKLQSNLVKERCLMLLVADVFLSHILTGTQMCKMLVHSYPRQPDGIAIVSAAAALHTPPTSRSHSGALH